MPHAAPLQAQEPASHSLLVRPPSLHPRKRRVSTALSQRTHLCRSTESGPGMAPAWATCTQEASLEEVPARLAFINPHCFFWSQRPLSSASPQVGAESQGSVHTPKAHAGQERGASSEQPCKGLGLGQGSGYRRPEQAPQTNSNSQQPPTERQDLRGDPNPKGRTVPHSGVQLLHSQKGTPHVPQRPRWPSGHPRMQRGTGYPRGSRPPINQPWPSVQRDEHAN